MFNYLIAVILFIPYFIVVKIIIPISIVVFSVTYRTIEVIIDFVKIHKIAVIVAIAFILFFNSFLLWK